MCPPFENTAKSFSPRSTPTTWTGSAAISGASGMVNSLTSVTFQLPTASCLIGALRDAVDALRLADANATNFGNVDSTIADRHTLRNTEPALIGFPAFESGKPGALVEEVHIGPSQVCQNLLQRPASRPRSAKRSPATTSAPSIGATTPLGANFSRLPGSTHGTVPGPNFHTKRRAPAMRTRTRSCSTVGRIRNRNTLHSFTARSAFGSRCIALRLPAAIHRQLIRNTSWSTGSADG